MIQVLARVATAVVLAGSTVGPAGAAVITALDDATPVAIPAISDDADSARARGPITFGPGITYVSTSANSLFGFTGEYGLTPEILWSGTPLIGLDAGRGTITLTFAQPVSGFLAEISSTEFTSTADAIITAYDATGTKLDSILLEHDGYQVTPGFMGFGYASNVISSITFANERIVFRNISVAQAVPETTTWLMLIAGVAAIGLTMRQRRFGSAAQPVRAAVAR